MRIVGLIFAWSLALPLAAVELLTPQERKEVVAVVEAVVAAGFPDARGGTIHRGPLKVAARFDSEREAPPLPADLSQMQETSSGSAVMTYRYTFSGVHVHLADGSWLIGLLYRFVPREGDEVIPEEGSVVDLTSLLQSAQKEKPFSAATEGVGWLKRVDPAQRSRATAVMDLLVPVSSYFKARPDDWAPLLILLQRSGWAEAAEISLIIADQRARSFWQMRAWNEPDIAFDPSGAYPQSKTEGAAWEQVHPEVTSEPPATALRRATYRWCRNQFLGDAPPFTAQVAAACCRACLDPQDPQGNLPRIALFEAASLLPADVPEKAALVTRLASWEAGQRRSRMLVSGGKDGSFISTSFGSTAPVYVPNVSDLDDLVALLDDRRASLFRDFSGIRTIGDNAWRALTVLLKGDPRVLAGHPVDRPWTSAERSAAAVAVQTWWSTHRGEFVRQITPVP